MQNAAMPGGDIIADHTRKRIGHVTDTQILNVGVMTDNHSVDVAPQNTAEPNAGAFPDGDFSNQMRTIGHIHVPAQLRLFALINVKTHCD